MEEVDRDWYYRPEHGELCRVWLPGKDTVVRLPATRLRPAHEADVGAVDRIAYLAAVVHSLFTGKPNTLLKSQGIPIIR